MIAPEEPRIITISASRFGLYGPQLPEGQRLKHLDEALKDRTKRLLANGQCFTIGFNTPRKASDVPLLIPTDNLQNYPL